MKENKKESDKMKIGEMDRYRVLRQTQIGYMLLNDEEEEVFLHNNECNQKTLKEGELLDAFVFYDKKGRTAATLFPPLLSIASFSFVEVVSVVESLGVFVDIGISKDILFSKDDLPQDFTLWPQIGDVLFGTLRIKKQALLFRQANKQEILDSCQSELLAVGDTVEAYAYYLALDGNSFLTKNHQVIFVYHTNMRSTYRLGQKVSIKIIHVSEQEYNGTLIQQKELQIDDDAQTILRYLQTHNNEMAFTGKSSPDVIKRVFNMSKSAFKNALGRLYKLQKIDLLDDKTVLK